MLKMILVLPVIGLFCVSLSGCLLAAAGAGAAGGVYAEKNYKIVKKDDKK